MRAVPLIMLVASACAPGPQVATTPARPSPPPSPAPAPMPAPPAQPGPDVEYVLHYVRAPAPVVEIAVTTRAAPGGSTTFDLGHGFANVSDPESSVRDVTATDAGGAALALEHPSPQRWRVRAEPHTPVTLHYTVFSTHAPTQADRFRTIVTDHLVHLVGAVALVEPSGLGRDKLAIRVTWTGLAEAGLQPATSFGSHPVEDVHETFESFRSSIYIASDAFHQTTRRVGDTTLEVAVVGSWSFGIDEIADYIARVMALERALFDDPGPPYFFVSVFPLGEGDGSFGGTGYTHSFDLALASGVKLDHDVREMIAHEHFHMWNGELITAEAFEDLTYWVTEGFTNFYTARLLYRTGLITLERYVEDVNEAVAHYLSSPVRELPNAQIAHGMWSADVVSKVPYDRGHMIALVADREIRRATLGHDSLDDVMRALVAAGKKGGTITSDRVLAMIESLTSTRFAARLRATAIDGTLLAIPPDLLEPCLTGKPGQMFTYDLGFDYGASDKAGKIVGLRATSAAARAGVHEGDRLTGRSIYFGNADKEVKLTVAGRKIAYLPRGHQVPIVVFAVHDATACADVLGAPLAPSHEPDR